MQGHRKALWGGGGKSYTFPLHVKIVREEIRDWGMLAQTSTYKYKFNFSDSHPLHPFTLYIRSLNAFSV